MIVKLLVAICFDFSYTANIYFILGIKYSFYDATFKQ